MTNDNGINDVVTDQEILSGVKFELNIVNTNMHDLYILNSINLRLRSLKNLLTFVPSVCELPIDLVTYTAQLPKGFIWLTGQSPIRTFNSLDTVNPIVSAPSANTNGFFKGQLNNSLNAQINGDYIYFGSDIKDNFCQISYMGARLDTNGNLVIPRYAEQCLIFGACADWCRARGDASYKPMYSSYDLDFKKQKAILRGIAAHSDTQDMKRTSNIYNGMGINTDGGTTFFR